MSEPVDQEEPPAMQADAIVAADGTRSDAALFDPMLGDDTWPEDVDLSKVASTDLRAYSLDKDEHGYGSYPRGEGPAGTLSPDHVELVRGYSTSGGTYGAVNEALRGKGLKDDSLEAKTVAALDRAFETGATTAPRQLYRGMAGREVEELGWEVGKEFTDPGFVSTALTQKDAGKFARHGDDRLSGEAIGIVMKINTGGTKALDMQRFSNYEEREMLLPRDTTFKVTSITPGVPGEKLAVVTVSVVTPKPASADLRAYSLDKDEHGYGSYPRGEGPSPGAAKHFKMPENFGLKDTEYDVNTRYPRSAMVVANVDLDLLSSEYGNDHRVRDMVSAIREGATFPPLTLELKESGKLGILDGRTRVAAFREAGIKGQVPAVIRLYEQGVESSLPKAVVIDETRTKSLRAEKVVTRP